VNATKIAVAASIDPELFENLIDIETIDADSVDNVKAESVMNIIEFAPQGDLSVTADSIKTKVLAQVKFSPSEKYPALRILKAVSDQYSLPRTLKLDYINGRPKKSIEHLVSMIKLATLKALINIKLEMNMSDFKKVFLEFVAYLVKMAIIHNEHSHMINLEKAGD
jgi:hypothetical protein